MAKQDRQWKGLDIDVNLPDEWLVALNAMKVLELRSICEGHTREDDPLSRNAHITAVFRRRQQPLFHRYWEELQGPVADLLGKCFCRDDARSRT